MKRTQIQFKNPIWERLREKAFREKRSVSAVVREIVEEKFKPKAPKKLDFSDFSFIGEGKSRGKLKGKISEKHNEALADDFE